MKVLLVTNQVQNYALGFQIVIDALLHLNHEVVWAANFSKFKGDPAVIPCEIRNIGLRSNPLHPDNWKAFCSLCRIIREEGIDAIQCSTPIGSMLGRIAGHVCKVHPVIYAAHGFLFFRGAPLINRTVYKLQEMWLARYTDVLITIVPEDFEASKTFHLRGQGKRYRIHGAGIAVGKQVHVDRSKKREEFGIPEDAYVIISGGFLNRNKNNQVIIQAMPALVDKNVYYLVCGDGELREQLVQQAKDLGVIDRVIFAGFRLDFAELMASSDLFAMPSFREGIPRSMLEAMDLGLPCIGSDTRGIRDLIGVSGEGGYLFDPHDSKSVANAVTRIIAHPDAVARMISRNQQEAKLYADEVVQQELSNIYQEVLEK